MAVRQDVLRDSGFVQPAGQLEVRHQLEQPLKFSQVGSDNGQIVIYFHGAPGAPEECAVFELYAKEYGLRLICFDRFAGDGSLAGEAYYQFLAQEISKQAAGKQVDVVGFSIGAFIALQTCRYLDNGVRSPEFAFNLGRRTAGCGRFS
jgi:pimeloyl-ACP methyl ester carboxylesterase